MEIISNGSKWAGQEPDDLETLLHVLKTHPLDSSFAQRKYGNFFYKMETENQFNAFGNFEDLSHVFNITGTLEELLPLALAIKENRKRFGIRLNVKGGAQ